MLLEHIGSRDVAAEWVHGAPHSRKRFEASSRSSAAALVVASSAVRNVGLGRPLVGARVPCADAQAALALRLQLLKSRGW